MNRTFARVKLAMEPLEDRLCMASSLGWDGAGQGSANLTYYIGNTPSSLSQAATVTAIETALKAWSSVADITFTRTLQPNQTDSLDITFGSIDGRNGTLAYAYFPDDVNPARIAGDIRFDASETWEVGNARGRAAFDLVLTAVHEIGHALGLEHSDDAGSVLADSISPRQAFTGLDASDVSEIRALYAPASSTSTPTPTTTIITSTPTTTTPTTNTESPIFRPRFPRFFFPRYFWGARTAIVARVRPTG